MTLCGSRSFAEKGRISACADGTVSGRDRLPRASLPYSWCNRDESMTRS